jgi:fructosamine-3-kinase
MLNPDLKLEVEAALHSPIVQSFSVGGGSISRTFSIVLANGYRYFLKTGVPLEMLCAEFRGLQELRKCNCIDVPEPVSVGPNHLVMEWIERGNEKSGFFEGFGKRLAQMHSVSSKHFGFEENNFIGLTPQVNNASAGVTASWIDFYLLCRLEPQMALARQNGYSTPLMEQLFAQLRIRLPDLLSGSEEPPALLHGDLWAGNFMVGQAGQPVIFDPAVYYGHREADLAMTRLFGGFTQDFYNAYQREWPLPPGYRKREPVYLLYHVLNHLNCFGFSYRNHAIELMQSCL